MGICSMIASIFHTQVCCFMFALNNIVHLHSIVTFRSEKSASTVVKSDGENRALRRRAFARSGSRWFPTEELFILSTWAPSPGSSFYLGGSVKRYHVRKFGYWRSGSGCAVDLATRSRSNRRVDSHGSRRHDNGWNTNCYCSGIEHSFYAPIIETKNIISNETQKN